MEATNGFLFELLIKRKKCNRPSVNLMSQQKKLQAERIQTDTGELGEVTRIQSHFSES